MSPAVAEAEAETDNLFGENEGPVSGDNGRPTSPPLNSVISEFSG